MACGHSKFEIPIDPHGKKRYESAMKHVEAAKKSGESSEEIHAIFKRIMESDTTNIDAIANDNAHAKHRSALIHAKKALSNGKSSEDAHEIFRKIKNGETTGHCQSK